TLLIPFSGGGTWRVSGENHEKIFDSQLQDESIITYPNPAKNLLNIQYNGFEEIKSLIIADPLGRTIKKITNTKPLTQISINELSAGKYFIILHIGVTKKITTFMKY